MTYTKIEIISKNCEWCGDVFTVVPSKEKHKKHCCTYHATLTKKAKKIKADHKKSRNIFK